jgi:hypothetical protein
VKGRDERRGYNGGVVVVAIAVVFGDGTVVVGDRSNVKKGGEQGREGKGGGEMPLAQVRYSI